MTIQETSNTDDSKKKTRGRKPNYQESGAKNKQRCNFARFYAEHGDKTRARREAKYSSSPNEHVLACRLADEPDVKKAVDYWKEKFKRKLDMRSEVVLGEIHSIAFSNIVDVWDWDEDAKMLTLKDVTRLPRHITAAIQEINTIKRTYYDASIEEEITEVAYKVKMHPKWQALKHIADIIKALKPHTKEAGGTESRRKVVQIKLVGSDNNEISQG